MYSGLYEVLKRKNDRWENEEEVRLGWVPAIEEAVGIEMHAERDKRDSSYNNVVIEFKGKGKFKGRTGSPAFKEAINDRLKPYILAAAQRETRDPSDYIGIAIDGDHVCFAQVSGGEITHGPLLPFSRTSVAMVALACKGAFRRAVTAENLTEDFGHRSDGGRQLMVALAHGLEAHAYSDSGNKVKMLFEEWRSMFGQVADLTTAQAEAARNGFPFTITDRNGLRIPLSLFVIHTYNSLVIKLLSAEILSAHGLTSHPHFAQKLATDTDDAILNALSRDIEGGLLLRCRHRRLCARGAVLLVSRCVFGEANPGRNMCRHPRRACGVVALPERQADRCEIERSAQAVLSRLGAGRDEEKSRRVLHTGLAGEFYDGPGRRRRLVGCPRS
jgi:hypothetical protein